MTEKYLSNIESFVKSETQKYEKISEDYTNYLSDVDEYLYVLKDAQANIKELKKYKEDILKFENKNKI